MKNRLEEAFKKLGERVHIREKPDTKAFWVPEKGKAGTNSFAESGFAPGHIVAAKASSSVLQAAVWSPEAAMVPGLYLSGQEIAGHVLSAEPVCFQGKTQYWIVSLEREGDAHVI